MIKKFKKYIKESRGISNIIKDYVNLIFEDFIKGEFDLTYDLNNTDLDLSNFNIKFIKSDEYSGVNINSESYYIDNTLYNCVIIIKYVDISEIDIIKGLITHEFNHLKEFFEIKKKEFLLNIKINNGKRIRIEPKWLDINTMRKYLYKINLKTHKSEFFNKFIYYIYISLDTEMNARISQLYFYLKAFNNKDYNFLFSKVKEHNNYKFYNSLNNFNHIEYTNLLISELGEDNTILVCNVINEKMRVVFRFNISTIEDVKSYFKKWEEIFKDKSNKHIKKIGKIISEVILDLDDNIIKEKHNSNQYDYLTLFEQIPSDGFLYTDMNPRIEYNTIFIEDKCVIKSGNKYKRV